VETDLLERCPGKSLQQCVGGGSLLIGQLRLYRSLRLLGGRFLCENDPKVFLDWVGAHGNLVRMRGCGGCL
jgi:hypothetical protein